MTNDELKQKRFDIIANLLDGVTHETGYALGPVCAALDDIDALDAEYTKTLESVVARQRETITALCSASPLFHAVLTASPRYVRRFKGTPTIEGAGRKVEEEYGEFMTAIKNLVAFASSTHHTATAAELEAEAAKEAVDLMVTIGGLLDAAGVRYDVVDAAAHSTLDKLDGRTDADYVWNPATKTVEKRSKLEAQS